MKLKDILKEQVSDIPQGTGWEMVRSLNTLSNDISNQKHAKLMAWAEKNDKQAKEITEMAEQMMEIIIKMRAR